MQIREVLAESKLVTVNRRLNPKIWRNNELDPLVAEKLLEIGQAFEEFIGIDLPVEAYTITGSNANYTWTQHSDLDLHLIVPGVPTDEERELYNAKKALWSEQHNIKIRGLPVECYVQGADEPHHSTGVYSLTDKEWLAVPKKIKPNIDDAAVKAKYSSMFHDTKVALASSDLERIREAKDKITKMRKAGLERAGEWSTENLVFKLLRNTGIIDQITVRIHELEDQELSLEQAQPQVLD